MSDATLNARMEDVKMTKPVQKPAPAPAQKAVPVTNRITEALAKVKLDLAGVDLTRARSKTGGVRFLSTAVRDALLWASVPRFDKLTPDEYALVAGWLGAQLKGQTVNPNALTAACSAACTYLEAGSRRVPTPPVPVTADAMADAMKRAVEIRKKRVRKPKSA